MPRIDVIKRIIKKISQTDEVLDLTSCWTFTGAWHDGKGYKKISIDDVTYYVHRVMFEWFYRRKLRKDIQLDHICCNRACCNPLHLKAMKNKKNSQLRSKRAKKKNIIKQVWI